MSVGIQVGRIVDEVGAPSFLNAFFSTIVARLEGGRRGSVHPAVTETLYSGHVDAQDVPETLAQLQRIRRELAAHAPGAVVWDLDDPQARPPWGDDISPAITSLADYFVTSTGRDLFELAEEALADAAARGLPVDVVEL